MNIDNYKGSRFEHCFHAAKGRCNNKNNEHYSDYGGRGIRFLFNSLSEWIQELGLPPSILHNSVDRKDVNSNYEKGNIRWATKKEQIHNRRRHKNLRHLNLYPSIDFKKSDKPFNNFNKNNTKFTNDHF